MSNFASRAYRAECRHCFTFLKVCLYTSKILCFNCPVTVPLPLTYQYQKKHAHIHIIIHIHMIYGTHKIIKWKKSLKIPSLFSSKDTVQVAFVPIGQWQSCQFSKRLHLKYFISFSIPEVVRYMQVINMTHIFALSSVGKIHGMAVAITGGQWNGMGNSIGTANSRESRGMAEATPGTSSSGKLME